MHFRTNLNPIYIARSLSFKIFTSLFHTRPNLHLDLSLHFSSEQSSNYYINLLCIRKLYKEALNAFDFLQKNTNFRLTLPTCTSLISACSALRSLEHGRKVHDHILASYGQQKDVILQNHVINMYGKCASLKEARKVFDEMTQRNVVTWTSVISGYSQNGHGEEAITLYCQMLRSGHKPDQFTFGSIIKACSGLDNEVLGKQLHTHVIKSDFGHHPIAQNALIAMYTKFSQINEALLIFSRIEDKDLISWGSIIAGFSQLGYEIEALDHFKEMLYLGVYEPNEFIFGSTFSACSSLLKPDYGMQIHGVCIKFGFGKNPFAGCSLCGMYAKCEYLESAKTVFYRIERPDLVSWNAVIAGFANGSDTEEALSFFSKMRLNGLVPNDVTILSLIRACSNPLMNYPGMQVHSFIIKTGFNSEIPVGNSLLTMYAKCSSMQNVFNLFEDLKDKADLVSWNSIFTACLIHNQAGDVFMLLKQMLRSYTKPDHVTIMNVLGACGEIVSLKMGIQVHCFGKKWGFILDTSVANGLINMYTKCGSLENAQKLFDLVNNPDVVSWSSLIVGYAQSGSGKKALELFQKIRDLKVKPNVITFVGVLTACSHIGLVEEGLKLFKTMETEHGISPTREHCSCMVDLLARAGRLNEAEEFIEKEMKFDSDIVVWKTLLAACKKHRNVEVGKRAAENVLKIDPCNSAALVLLCNIHASFRDWGEVARLRRLMKQRDVKKIPGQSWIEVEDRVHVFHAEDSLHPERDKIYIMLEELWGQMLDDSIRWR